MNFKRIFRYLVFGLLLCVLNFFVLLYGGPFQEEPGKKLDSLHVYSNETSFINCGDLNTKRKYDVIMFTTMYFSKSTIEYFMNQIRVTSSLVAASNGSIKAVLFPDEFISSTFSEYICSLGWTVLKIPKANKYGFPVFKSMFAKVQKLWNATWYGYFNGDILFDETLLSTLKFLEKPNDFWNTTVRFASGRRFWAPVRTTKL